MNLKQAIQSLNAQYGVGDLRAFRLFADGRVEADFQPFGLPLVTRRGTLRNGTLRMFGRQRKVTT